MSDILSDENIHQENFAARDLMGLDRWEPWVVVFTGLTLVGALTYLARYRFVGAELRFQIQFSGATSIASAAGTTYFALPVRAKGLDGQATMANKTTNLAVGNCVIDVVNSRCWLPAQAASGNNFAVSGWYEVSS